MIKIYVGLCITGAPQEFIGRVVQLKERLRENYEVLDFVPVTIGTPADVYRHDIKECIARCDMMVAVCDLPSTGLGYELASAIEAGNKPVLAVAHHDAAMSRLITGIDHPKYTFRRYQHLDEVVEFVHQKVCSHFEARR